MILVNNGNMKEVNIIKHFKVGLEEYVLYQDTNIVSIGLIEDNKLLLPNSEKINALMKILGEFISNKPNKHVEVLSNDFNVTLAEIGSQRINMSVDQLYRLTNPSENNIGKNTNKWWIMLIIGVILVIVVLLVFLFKDKIFK